MTIRELVTHLIEHADEKPATIDPARAAEMIGLLDPDSVLPENLSPESFMSAWNDVIQEGAYEDNWSR